MTILRPLLAIAPGEPQAVPAETGALRCTAGRGELYLRTQEARHFLGPVACGDPLFPDFGEGGTLLVLAFEPLTFAPLAAIEEPAALQSWRERLGLEEEDAPAAEDAAGLNRRQLGNLAAEARVRDEALLARVSHAVPSLLPPPASRRAGACAAVRDCAQALSVWVEDFTGPQDNRLAAVPRHARRAGLHAREVRLGPDWTRADQGPLVVRRASDGTLVAALWRRGAYRIAGEEAAASAPDFEAAAFVLGRGLPRGMRGFGGILALALRGSADELGGIALAALLMALAGLLPPVAIGAILSQAAPSGDVALLLAWGLALGFGALVTYVLGALRGMFTGRLLGKSAMHADAALFDRVLLLPARFFRDHSAGDLNQRIAGFGQVRELALGIAITAGLSALLSAIYLALLVWYDAALALLAVGLTAITVVIVLAARVLQLPLIRKAASLDGMLAEQTYETIGALPKLRSAAAETRALARWSARYAEERDCDYGAARIGAWTAAVGGGWQTVTIVALYGAAALLAAEQLAPSQFIAFLVAFGIFQGAFVTLATQLVELFAAQPQLERLRPLLEAVPESAGQRRDPGPLSGAIALRNVAFRYGPDAPPVLADVSLDVPAGAHVAIVGASGSGKSTLLRLLLGFETPSAGAVLFDGQDLAGLDPLAVRGQIGAVLQSSSLFAGSIIDNIRGAHQADLEECLAAAAAAGLAEDLATFPMGLHTPITEGAAVLSGGQRQRILIARALVARPRILFFDEATSALDNRTQALVAATLDSLAATRVTIAHRLSTVARADCICVLEGGRIAERGTYAELMALDGAFAALARRQIEES